MLTSATARDCGRIEDAANALPRGAGRPVTMLTSATARDCGRIEDAANALPREGRSRACRAASGRGRRIRPSFFLRRTALLLAAFLAMFLPTPLCLAQTDPVEDPVDHNSWSYFPVLGYSPKTSLMLGAGAVFTFLTGDADEGPQTETEARRSSLTLIGAGTLEGQFFVELSPDIYWDRENWQVAGTVEASYFPQTFFPVGNDSNADDAESYTQLAFSSHVSVTRRVISHLRAGLKVAVHYGALEDLEPGGLLDQGVVLGTDPYLLLRVGPTVIWDDRDHTFYPSRGGRYELSITAFHGLLDGDIVYPRYFFDARQFFPLWAEHVLGLHLHVVSNRGDVPFQAMALLGGSERMRGFMEGRYRDNDMAVFQVEYRLPIWWRFSAAAFASVGDVAGDLSELSFSELKVAGGGGFRFSLNPDDRVNLRFDIAGTSDGDFNFYVDLGEAF